MRIDQLEFSSVYYIINNCERELFMRNWIKVGFSICIVILMLLFSKVQNVSAGDDIYQSEIDIYLEEAEEYAKEMMAAGKIPGMSIVIVKDDKILLNKGYGFADLDEKIPVTQETLFEVASCSKSYTAVALLQLRNSGTIRLDDFVSEYFPGFYVTYKGRKYDITLRQLLHHTSGIPFSTISLIPESNSEYALENVVENLIGIEVDSIPGEKYSYATINYDILGAIIQKASGQLFEDYITENVFIPFNLDNTYIYSQNGNPNMAKGYKQFMFHAEEYNSPVYRGNRPAGYVISNANDVAKWLMLQTGAINHDLYKLLLETQEPDRTVPPRSLDGSSYAMGWASYQLGSGEIAKAGSNPSFSAYMTFRPEDKVGVGILTNNNSEYAFVIGKGVLDILQGKEPTSYYRPEEDLTSWDTTFSLLIILSVVTSLCFTFYLILAYVKVFKRKWHFKGFQIEDFGRLAAVILIVMLALFSMYIFPLSFDYSWETAVVWLPQSFLVSMGLLLLMMGLGAVCFLIGYFFLPPDEGKNRLPFYITLSFAGGIFNYAVIAIINSYIYGDKKVQYMAYYFTLCLILYIGSRKIVETGLVRITNKTVYQKRVEILRRILSADYEEYEKLDGGRILATLNNDTETIGHAANVIVSLITYVITVICCFVYMGTISAIGTVIILISVVFIASVYIIIVLKANTCLEEARTTQNVYMKYIDMIMKGFKELSLRVKSKTAVLADIDDICLKYREKNNRAKEKFVDAYLTGETTLILILGIIAFFLSDTMKSAYVSEIQDNYRMIQFIVTFLYIIGPINGIVGVIPSLSEIRIAWKRIGGLEADITEKQQTLTKSKLKSDIMQVNSIVLKNISYTYSYKEYETGGFKVGPVNLSLERGDILFITGGNGSGKTTLAKLLTGLYTAEKGEFQINNCNVGVEKLRELFSAIFSDFYLFDKIYGIDLNGKEEIIRNYLKLLELDQKVQVENGRFTTTKLSNGQRKRLALLICLLEDRPLYLLDEWAAEQDPQYRKFFYRTILMEMKSRGKIVIAITHDEGYFDVADKIIKMNEGHMEIIKM